MSKRVLVLSSSTGSGHDMRAKAFVQWIHHLYGEAVEVRVEQIIERGSRIGQFGVWLYNSIQRHWPFLHNLYFFIVEVLILTHGKRVGFGGNYYRQCLKAFRPDVILSVQDSTNRGYFDDAKRLLGETVRCVTYCGEFSGGYGYSRNWVNPITDLFIARTEPAREYAVRVGILREKTAVFHKFLPPALFKEKLSQTEIEDMRTQLGLDPNRFTLFLATGGYGANHHLKFLRAILPLAEHVQVIVICGRNQRVFNKLNQWKAAHPQLKTFLEGYSNQVAEFLQISHAIVTRGGANTTMEALHFNCPILYNTLGGLMPQEHCTTRYAIDRGVARRLHHPTDLFRILKGWCQFDTDYQAIQKNLESLHIEEDPRTLIQQILVT